MTDALPSRSAAITVERATNGLTLIVQQTNGDPVVVPKGQARVYIAVDALTGLREVAEEIVELLTDPTDKEQPPFQPSDPTKDVRW